MRSRFVAAAALASGAALAPAETPRAQLNPLAELLAQKKPVFGLYAPGNRRPDAPKKTPLELARETLAYRASDFVFDGSMEGGLERSLPAFAEFVKALAEAAPANLRAYPLMVKTPKIAADPAQAVLNISRQLNLGVSGIVFVEVESADDIELRMKQGFSVFISAWSEGGWKAVDIGRGIAGRPAR